MRARRYLKPWIFGVAAGVMFVGADALLPISPPSAYAFCLSCHVRDLVTAIVNSVAHSRFPASEVGSRALMLTSPGVLIGALLAAWINGEIHPRRASRPVLYAVLGLLVMVLGITIFGCTTRIVLRAGYGEIYGIVALVGMFAGVAISTVFIKWRVKRGVRS